MPMEWQPKRRVFAIFMQSFTFLLVILQGLCAYALAAVVVSDAALCAHFSYRAVLAGSGVSSGLPSSWRFQLLVVRAFNTQILSTMFVESLATVDLELDQGLFRARAMAILASLRKRTVHTFLNAVAIVCSYTLAILSAFRLLDVLSVVELPFMLLGGGAVYLCGTMCITVLYRRPGSAVPVIHHHDARASGFGDMPKRLGDAGNFFMAAAFFSVLGGILVPAAVQTALPSQMLAAGMATNAVLCTVVVVVLVAQPMVYLVLWDNDHPV